MTEVTQLLYQLSQGDENAADAVMPLIYTELRELAQQHMAWENPGHTLQPTALVNEAYLRLVGREGVDWPSRGHFYSMASKIMRSLLVDHARQKKAQKRGGDRERLALADQEERGAFVDVLALHDALERLVELNEEMGRIAELRIFGGLQMDEIAQSLNMSRRTIERRYAAANAWLQGELGDD